jgi:HEAT repeat protein
MNLELDERDLSQVVGDLIDSFRSHDWAVSFESADALANFGQSATLLLIRALKDPDAYVRDGAAKALIKIKDPRAFDALIEALQNKGDGVNADGEITEARLSAALALGEVGDLRAYEALVKTLEETLNNDLCLSWYVVESLGKLGDRRAISVISALTDHPDIDMRKSAGRALRGLEAG